MQVKPCDWNRYWDIYHWCEERMGTEGRGRWTSTNLRIPDSCDFYINERAWRVLFKLTWC